nr:AIF_HP1_G0030720.mRNA.1.CDS.1 [Saccharomyces cerevisiae]
MWSSVLLNFFAWSGFTLASFVSACTTLPMCFLFTIWRRILHEGAIFFGPVESSSDLFLRIAPEFPSIWLVCLLPSLSFVKAFFLLVIMDCSLSWADSVYDCATFVLYLCHEQFRR